MNSLLIIAYLINAQPVLISRTSTQARKAKSLNAFHKPLLTEYATGTSIVQIRHGEDATHRSKTFEGRTIGRFDTVTPRFSGR